MYFLHPNASQILPVKVHSVSHFLRIMCMHLYLSPPGNPRGRRRDGGETN